jgi:hypothetical protein
MLNVAPTVADNLATFAVLAGTIVQAVKQLRDNQRGVEEYEEDDEDSGGGGLSD